MDENEPLTPEEVQRIREKLLREETVIEQNLSVKDGFTTRQKSMIRWITLRGITLALQRMAEGTYGDCCFCGQEISRERLERTPDATICLSCSNSEQPNPFPVGSIVGSE